MDEEGEAATHVVVWTRIEVEGAWSRNWGIVHRVHTASKCVLTCRERSHIRHTLVRRVEVAFSIASIALSVDVPLVRATNEVASVLVEIVGLRGARHEGLAAFSQALGTGQADKYRHDC